MQPPNHGLNDPFSVLDDLLNIVFFIWGRATVLAALLFNVHRKKSLTHKISAQV
jgi:hypothetical protein